MKNELITYLITKVENGFLFMQILTRWQRIWPLVYCRVYRVAEKLNFRQK